VCAWLEQHPGYGRCNGAEPADDDDTSDTLNAVRLAEAEELYRQIVPLSEDGPAQRYLARRGLSGDAVAGLAELPVNIARAGDAALVALLETAGRVVGFQLCHVTPDGHKSTIKPLRRSYHIEQGPHCKAATFGAWPLRTAWPVDAPLLTCEGVEDARSLQITFPGRSVVGVPGVRVWSFLAVPAGAEIVIVRDGDKPNSPADTGLQDAIDSMLLQGARVSVTATPAESDANDLLRGPDGIAALVDLVAGAKPAELSLAGLVTQLAHEDDFTLQPRLGEIAKARRVTLTWLRKAITVARKKPTPWQLRGAAGPWDAAKKAAPPRWTGDLGATLGRCATQLGRFVLLPEPSKAMVALWIAHKHLEGNRAASPGYTCHLRLEGPTNGTGKTACCEVVGDMVPAGQPLTAYTAAAVARAYHAADQAGTTRPTLLLDETDLSALRSTINPELQALLNGATRPGGAFKSVTEQLPNNTRVVVQMDVFGGVVLSGIGPAPNSLADRSIRVLFQRETADRTNDLAKFYGHTEALLTDVRDDLAAWAAALTEPLPVPALPDWLRRQSGRTAGNWMLLLTVATAAGGEWPDLVRQAAEAEFHAEREVHEFERLLASISRCFATRPEWDGTTNEPLNHRDRVLTEVLLNFLNNVDREEEWDRAHSGKPVNAYWLRSRLRNQLTPAGSQDWFTRPANAWVHHSGYYQTQFTDVWRRYQTPLPGAPTAAMADSTPPAQGNGHAAEAEAEPTAGNGELPDGAFESELAAHRAAHPTWTARQLAKAMKQPLERVQRRLSVFH
jgi:hypothetical protein